MAEFNAELESQSPAAQSMRFTTYKKQTAPEGAAFSHRRCK